MPASEQRQVALVLGFRVFFEDLRVFCGEDTPRHRLLYATARLALDPCDHATGRAQGVLLGWSGL